MYAANDETSRGHAQRHLGVDVEKCFILTPTYHFVNPTFPKAPSYGPLYRDVDLAPDSPVKISAVSDPALPSVFRSPNVAVPVTPSQGSTLSSWDPENHQVPSARPASRILRSSKQVSSNLSVSAVSPTSHQSLTVPALAKRFANLVEDSGEKALDLAEAAAQLGVQQQCLHDIADILEGAGLIVKQGTKYVHCPVDRPTPSDNCRRVYSYPSSSDSDGVGRPPTLTTAATFPSSPCVAALKDELKNLVHQESQLDSFTRYVTGQLQQLRAEGCTNHSGSHRTGLALDTGNHLYLRHQDLVALPGYSSQTILGVRAPTGTTLEVPDPDTRVLPGVRRFEIHLSSRTAQQKNGRFEPITVDVIMPRVSMYHPRVPNRASRSYIHETHPAQRYLRYPSRNGECQPYMYGRSTNTSGLGPNIELIGHGSRKRPYTDLIHNQSSTKSVQATTSATPQRH
jgi:hypothetical protein